MCAFVHLFERYPYNMTTKVTVNLSEEKLAAIQALFAYNDWDWDPEHEFDQEHPVTEHRPIISKSDGHFECPDCFVGRAS